MSVTAGEPDTTTATPIVFFDGVCGLCNSSVDFVLRRDKAGRIRFAPLQGETAAKLLPSADREGLDSLVFWDNGRLYRRSSAIVRILWRLGPLWRFLGSLLWVVPVPLRNVGYRLVAKRRYRMFGKKETCRLPTPEERDRLLY